jgi:hypothetical protein
MQVLLIDAVAPQLRHALAEQLRCGLQYLSSRWFCAKADEVCQAIHLVIKRN